MRHRPMELTLLACLCACIALSLPLQVMSIYGHELYEASAICSKMTWLNWLVFSGAVGCAALLWRASPRSRSAVPALIALVALNNIVVGAYGNDYSPWLALGATLAFASANVPLLFPHIVWLLRHPEQRWWLRAMRTRVNIPVLIEGTRLASLQARSFDMSASGVFLPNVGMSVGDWITLRMTFGGIAQIRCQGRVVRQQEPTGVYPAGVGIEFVNMSWRQRRDLARQLAKQPGEPIGAL